MRCSVMSAVAAVGLGLVVLPGGGTAGGKDAKTLLTEAQFAKLVAEDGKTISETLAKPMFDKKDARKVQTGALMIAAYGDFTKHSDGAIARINGKQLFGAVKANALGNAKTIAATIYPKLQPTKISALQEPEVDIGNYMHIFASPRLGGFGVEQELNDLEEVKGAWSDAQLARLADLSLKIAVIAQVAPKFAPEKDEKDMTKANWLAWAGELRTNAVALHEAAAGKNEAKTRQALETLGKTCTKCHDVFR